MQGRDILTGVQDRDTLSCDARAGYPGVCEGAGCPGGCAGAGYPNGCAATRYSCRVCSYEIFNGGCAGVCVCVYADMEINPGFFSPLLDLM